LKYYRSDLEATPRLKDTFEGHNSSNTDLLHEFIFIFEIFMFENKFTYAKILVGLYEKRENNYLDELKQNGDFERERRYGFPRLHLFQ
jgi:hypothetical protein